jgi:hypothetical protein
METSELIELGEFELELLPVPFLRNAQGTNLVKCAWLVNMFTVPGLSTLSLLVFVWFELLVRND